MVRAKSAFVSRRVPLYYQLENLLRERILSGAWAEGMRLPTEDELIEQYGISRITVRQALRELVDEGLIERRQGLGSFVTQRRTEHKRLEGKIHLIGSLDEVMATVSDEPSQVLEMNKIAADAHEAELLGMQKGDSLYRIKRLRLTNGTPYSYLVNYLPADIGAQLTRAELSSGSLLKLLENKMKIRLREARLRITADLADPYVAGLLSVRIGTPLLSIEQTVSTDDGSPIEYVRVLYRSDLYSYSVFLTRDSELKSAAAKARSKLARSNGQPPQKKASTRKK